MKMLPMDFCVPSMTTREQGVGKQLAILMKYPQVIPCKYNDAMHSIYCRNIYEFVYTEASVLLLEQCTISLHSYDSAPRTST